MKTYIRLFLILFFAAIPALAASAANPQKYFESLGSKKGYSYSYVSPIMLKAMGSQYISDNKAYGSLPITTDCLTSIESLSTPFQGQDEDLWKTIRELKKDKKMETLSTKKQDFYRYDVLARLSNDSKFITHLMVVTQNGGQSVDVVYMEGKIPLESLKYDLVK